MLDTTPGRVLGCTKPAVIGGLSGLSYLRGVVPPVRPSTVDRAVRVLRAVAVALPILGAVAVLLPSADAVFARLLVPNVRAWPILGHVALTAVLAGVVLCIGAAASRGPQMTPVRPSWRALHAPFRA